MEEPAAERTRASIWWWLGGLAIGVTAVFLIALGAMFVVFLAEVREDAKRNEHITDQLPAVQAAVEQMVSEVDPDAPVVPAGSCNGDSPARVSVFLETSPDRAVEVAEDLERRARAAGWQPNPDASVPEGELERSFDGQPFGFEASPEISAAGGPYTGVFVTSYFLGTETCG